MEDAGAKIASGTGQDESHLETPGKGESCIRGIAKPLVKQREVTGLSIMVDEIQVGPLDSYGYVGQTKEYGDVHSCCGRVSNGAGGTVLRSLDYHGWQSHRAYRCRRNESLHI